MPCYGVNLSSITSFQLKGLHFFYPPPPTFFNGSEYEFWSKRGIKESVISPLLRHTPGQNGPEMSCPAANEVGVYVCVRACKAKRSLGLACLQEE